MESVVHQPLGDVRLVNPGILERSAVEYHLMSTPAFCAGIKNLVITPEACFDIVGIQYGEFCSFCKSFTAEHHHVGMAYCQYLRTAERRPGNRCDSMAASCLYQGM